MKTILIEGENFEQAKREISKNRDKRIIFVSKNDELNRKILEKEKIDVLLLDQYFRKDKQKQRNSGLNQVLSKIAKKKNIKIGINLDELIFSTKEKRAKIFARVSQNIKLCNKNKIEMVFVITKKNKRDIYDLKALGLVLGMPTWMTKKLTLEEI